MVCLLLAHVFRNAPEPKNRKATIGIIRLNNIPYISYGCFILIWGSHIVKTWRLRVVTIATCVVYSTNERDLPPWSQIFEERRRLDDSKFLKGQLTTRISKDLLSLLNFMHLEDHSIDFTNVFANCRYFYLCLGLRIWYQLEGYSVKCCLGCIWIRCFECFGPAAVHSSVELKLDSVSLSAAATSDFIATVRPVKLYS